VLKAFGRISVTYVAYVCLLLGFVALGLFVYALAAGSPVAGMIGGGMIILLVTTVVLFRAGARKLAESNDSGIEIPGMNIFATPLKRDQIAQYHHTYRGAQDRQDKTRLVAVAAGAPTRHDDERRAA
jgi:hypothetical protein